MYQKNKINFHSNRPKFIKKDREPGFHGYYAEVRDGEDPMRAFRKIKKKQKDVLNVVFVFLKFLDVIKCGALNVKLHSAGKQVE